MASTTDLLNSIRSSGNGWTLAELLTAHPAIARRTAQRLIAKLIDSGQVAATGEGRARRYFGAVAQAGSVARCARADRFPTFIPLSADSQDILAYIDQPAAARKPVGYQRDFLDAYRPNATWYLSDSLRRQLHKMGRTTDGDEPAGTYSRAILNRLLIDLSWASSHLEGNTYSRLDTRELIEHGKAARGKAAIETQMILNHKTAIELLVENIEEALTNRASHQVRNATVVVRTCALPALGNLGVEFFQESRINSREKLFAKVGVQGRIFGDESTEVGRIQFLLLHRLGHGEVAHQNRIEPPSQQTLE